MQLNQVVMTLIGNHPEMDTPTLIPMVTKWIKNEAQSVYPKWHDFVTRQYHLGKTLPDTTRVNPNDYYYVINKKPLKIQRITRVNLVNDIHDFKFD